MATTIQFKRGTSARWAQVNPILAAGEPGYETDTGKHKIGDGATAWSSLPYASSAGGGEVEPSDYYTKLETYSAEEIDDKLGGKVDEVEGKGLSDQNYTLEEKNKLSGLSNYTHPSSHPATMITEDAAHRFLTDTERTKLSGIQSGATANDTDVNLKNRANHTGTQTSATISDFQEAVQDAVAALLGAGSNVILNYDDAANSLTISSTGAGGTGLDAEQVRDAIGVALVGVGNIAITVNDAADTITITTTATKNSTDAQLRDRSTHTGTQSADTITDGTNNKVFTAAEKTKLAAITGSNTGDETGATIKAKLESITTEADKLDASAIKNLPSAGSADLWVDDTYFTGNGTEALPLSLNVGNLPTGQTLEQRIASDELFDHLTGAQYYGSSNTGTGAGVSHIMVSGKFGVANLTTGTTATGRASIRYDANGDFQTGSYSILLQTSVRVPILSNTTEEYQTSYGLTSSITTVTIAQNISFIYDRATVGSDVWAIRTNNTGPVKLTPTAIPVVAGQWYTLRIEVNKAGTVAKFYIDGVLVYTETDTTELPSIGTALFYHLLILKSVGATARELHADYRYHKIDFNGA
jgi:hypothetical protein